MAGGRDAASWGLPGYGWEGANANVLIAGDAHDPALGVPSARSSLCRIYPGGARARRTGRPRITAPRNRRRCAGRRNFRRGTSRLQTVKAVTAPMLTRRTGEEA